MNDSRPCFPIHHLAETVSSHMQKDDRVRAVFVAEVKIPENGPFRQNRDFRHFGGNFDFDRVGSILGLLTQIFFMLVNNYLYFRLVPCLDLKH